MAIKVWQRSGTAWKFGVLFAFSAGLVFAFPARNYDRRGELSLREVGPAEVGQLRRLEAFVAARPNVRYELNRFSGATRSLVPTIGFLTEETSELPAEEIAALFLEREVELLGLLPEDLAEMELRDRVVSRKTGTTHLYYRQRYQGVPVYNGQLQIHIAKDGRVLMLTNDFVPNLKLVRNAEAPLLEPEAAIQAAASELGLEGGSELRQIARYSDPARTTRFLAPKLSLEPIEVSLAYLPVGREARLVWNFQIWTIDHDHVFDLTVDALDGSIWTRYDWVADAQYKVYPPPVESPLHTTPPPPADARVTLTDPWHLSGSPFGWHDTNGSPGAEHTITRGNNVHAWEDSDGNNSEPPLAGEIDCGPTLDCVFPLDLTQPPSAYRPAAVANLFYWNNIIHDIEYLYGFDEPAGNFQDNTYGNGGTGNDHVRALAQSGAGTCNANFLTPPDGSSGRMRMYICDHDSNPSTPSRDGDLDNLVIVHEYGHGISNRLVGGPSNVSCLGNQQQPGEGLSDWWGLVYTHEPGDAGTDARVVGLYLIGSGIRPQPYSTDPSVNTYTYQTIGSGVSVPHGVGSVWAQAYWEVYWRLVQDHGFEPNLWNASSTAGNIRAKHYINEGLKLTACSPTFLDVRDGILAAANTLYGGEDVCRMWEAFAAFGLGVDATTVGPNSLSATNGFSVPTACSFGSAGSDARICAGANHNQTVLVGPAFTSPPVNLSVSGNPAGTTVTYSENPVSGPLPKNVTVTIGNTGSVPQGSYTVNVQMTAGSQSYTDGFVLTVDAAAPGTPVLATPLNQTSGHPLRPTFSWSAVPEAQSFLLEVDDEPNFSTPVYTATVSGNSHVPTSDLPGGGVLYWRVTPQNTCGSGTPTAVWSFATSAGQFCSSGGTITIPDSGVASTYPSTVAVSGAPVNPASIQVVLNNLTHTYPDDLDFLLVGPGGQTLVLLSDVGGGGDVNGIQVILDDNAASVPPDAGPLATGSYRPSNVTGGDSFPSPAPAGPHNNPAPAGSATLLSTFGSGDPNGTWSLFLVDDFGGDQGSLGGWCLELPVAMPFMDGFETGNTSRWSQTVP